MTMANRYWQRSQSKQLEILVEYFVIDPTVTLKRRTMIHKHNEIIFPNADAAIQRFFSPLLNDPSVLFLIDFILLQKKRKEKKNQSRY